MIAAVATTTACFMDLVSPLTLYFNYDLIFKRGQYWRLISSFLFFGSFSIDFLFHMYFLVTRIVWRRIYLTHDYRSDIVDYWKKVFFEGERLILY